MANRGDGSFDRHFLFGATAPQYVTWIGGHGRSARSAAACIGDTPALGLDAIFPAFFLALLLVELRDAPARGAALGGGLIALALVPFAPAGMPVLAASLAALVGLRRRRRVAERRRHERGAVGRSWRLRDRDGAHQGRRARRVRRPRAAARGRRA